MTINKKASLVKTSNKRAKTNAIVNNIGINKANSLWLISESSLCYDFTSSFTDDDHYIDGMELISVPPVITTECLPF